MNWEARTESVGNWVEAKIIVERAGGNLSWVGQLMMRPEEWQDIASRIGLQQGDNGVWRSEKINAT